MKIIACSASYGAGGFGQHFAYIVEQSRSINQLLYYLAPDVRKDDDKGMVLQDPIAPMVMRYTPLRYSPGWTNYLVSDWFDSIVAKKLPTLPKANSYEGFGGQALQSFRVSRKLGYQQLELQAANSHVHNVIRQHQQAFKRYSFEKSWLNELQARKTIKEYALADVIHVASEYTRQSFLNEGIPNEKIRLRHFTIDARFAPPPQRSQDGIFRIVCVGSLTVMKGIPDLVEAFSRLPIKQSELILVGGWATRGMRKYLESKMATDARIKIAPGNPIPHLHKADVYVHPTYEDGFAYAPMEALACGVPTIVTEDTGMKDHVREGVNGYIVPTGDIDALVERLMMVWKHPLVGSWIDV